MKILNLSLNLSLVLALILGMAACSGGGTNKSGVERNNNSSESGGDTGTPPGDDDATEPDPDPDPDPESPVSIQLDGNLYFPVAEGVTWHYSNGDEVTFTTGQVIQGRTLVSMQHSSSAMPREEYFQVSNNALHYGGLYAFFAYQGLGVEGGVEFHNLRRVYDHILDSGAGRTLFAQKADMVDPDGKVVSEVEYLWSSQVGAKELVTTGQYGDVPAVALVVNIDLAVTVGGIPVQTFPVIETTLWLSPGLGVVARSLGTESLTLERVDGVQAPLVFAFDQGSGLTQPPQQLLVDGSAVTDTEVDMVVAYGTRSVDWLSLTFDGTGSWRLSLTGAELPRGIHGAVIQMTRQGVRTDIPISVLVR
ncbi:MAG: hypothetical protein VYA55_10170 [Pseudomonadota bacterium]|nr:hypothetical protein [Pseudomonadota bacterium]